MSYESGWNSAGSFCCFTEEAQTRPIKNRVSAIKNTECLLLSIGVTSWGWLNVYGIFLYRETWWLHGWAEEDFSPPHWSSNYVVVFFLLLNSLDALDLSLRASCTHWFDCLPGNWWEANLLKGKQTVIANEQRNCKCGQGPCHTCGFFSVMMVIMLYIWAGAKGSLVLLSACHHGC